MNTNGIRTTNMVHLLRAHRPRFGVVFQLNPWASVFARRAYVLIDREGVVRWFHVEDQLGHRRQTDELLARIEELD